jgi:NAD(P)-dependent dehydrogenase (short-subunit alcohol dehydrogenase family)
MFDLTGMTALVTGASGGIGSAIAQALAAQGARLAVSGSNADKLNAFRDTLGGDHVALPCNLATAPRSMRSCRRRSRRSASSISSSTMPASRATI